MRRGFITLLCLAILSLASAPAGFMPARAGDGTLVLQICSGTNPRTITIEVPTGESHDRASDQADEGDGCDYGTFSGFGLPPVGGFTLLAIIQPIEQASVPDALTGIFPAALPPSTGPPAA